MRVASYKNANTEFHELRWLLFRACYYELDQLEQHRENSPIESTEPFAEPRDIDTPRTPIARDTTAISEYDVSSEEMIDAIGNINIPYAKSLQNRISLLSKLAVEEYPHQAPIAPDSLKDFITFLQLTPDIIPPSVVLTPEGNIQAEWHKGHNRHLVIEFTGEEDVIYVIFAPDPKHPSKTVHDTGRATVTSVIASLKPYGFDSWVTENGKGNDNK